jgi:hypothetical protein
MRKYKFFSHFYSLPIFHVLTPLPPLCCAKRGSYIIVYELLPPLYEVERGNKRG